MEEKLKPEEQTTIVLDEDLKCDNCGYEGKNWNVEPYKTKKDWILIIILFFLFWPACLLLHIIYYSSKKNPKNRKKICPKCGTVKTTNQEQQKSFYTTSFAIMLILGIVIIIVGVAFFSDNDTGMFEYRRNEVASSQTKGLACTLVGAVIIIGAFVYYNHEKSKALMGNDIKNTMNKTVNKKETTATTQTSATKLKELKELLDNGIITQEEFDTKKKDLLSKM